MQRVHFIAIGGEAMHNLAIALSKKNEYEVTGSDIEIFEPSYSRLKENGLLPREMGWFPERIHKNLNAVILGMHAAEDNPELIRAKELGIHIYSFPEYLFQQTRSKTRIVVGGSHGKTTTTAMILYVLKKCKIKADYIVGEQIEGYDERIKLSFESRIAVFEGDEYLTSMFDRRPKFHLYKPHIAILTGIAWNHIHVFPTLEIYVDQFRQFLSTLETQARLIYYAGDENLKMLADEAENTRRDVVSFPYNTPRYETRDGVTYVKTRKWEVPLRIFGEHNLQNLEAAHLACRQIGVTDDNFYKAIADFPGVTGRMQKIVDKPGKTAFRDYANSPSKLRATVNAARKQYPDRTLVACMELHTVSNLTEEFLHRYAGGMKDADVAFVYFNPEVIRHNHLKELAPDEVRSAFGGKNITVFTEISELQKTLRSMNYDNSVLLFMTSDNFSGINIPEFAEELLK